MPNLQDICKNHSKTSYYMTSLWLDQAPIQSLGGLIWSGKRDRLQFTPMNTAMQRVTLILLAAMPVLDSAAGPLPPAPRFGVSCLPSGNGYLRARLAGAVEAAIDWPNAGTVCEGGARPGGRGLRLSFHREPGGVPDLLFVFGIADVKAGGTSAKQIGVNLTIFERGTSRVFGTRSDSRCMVDALRQTPVPGAPHAFRVEARGFCTQPAHAVRAEGSVLVSTFDFAGLATTDEESGTGTERLDTYPRSALSVRTSGGAVHRFNVWIADNESRREQGLMFLQKLDKEQGMLFVFPRTQPVSFWMKNTYIPLDMIFIEADGRIAGIAENTTPLSEAPIPGPKPVKAVLELRGGTAGALSLKRGDRVIYREFPAGPMQ
jgi:uncharacterized membrane protein (UPF0127 family)